MCNTTTRATLTLDIGGFRGPWSGSIRSLSHRNYRRLWFGQLISRTGTFIHRTAQQWLVYRLTRSSLHLSIVGFVTFLPVFLFTPLAGVLVDRASKRRPLLGAQIAFLLLAIILAGLILTGVIQFWDIVLLAFLLDLAESVEKTARHSLMMDLVGRIDLMNAVSLHAFVFDVARFVGPAAAGIIVGRLGMWNFCSSICLTAS